MIDPILGQIQTDLSAMNGALKTMLDTIGEAVSGSDIDADAVNTYLDCALRYTKEIDEIGERIHQAAIQKKSSAPIEPESAPVLAIAGETIVIDTKRTPRFFELLEEFAVTVEALRHVDFRDDNFDQKVVKKVFVDQLSRQHFLLVAMARDEDSEEWHRV